MEGFSGREFKIEKNSMKRPGRTCSLFSNFFMKINYVDRQLKLAKSNGIFLQPWVDHPQQSPLFQNFLKYLYGISNILQFSNKIFPQKKPTLKLKNQKLPKTL